MLPNIATYSKLNIFYFSFKSTQVKVWTSWTFSQWLWAKWRFLAIADNVSRRYLFCFILFLFFWLSHNKFVSHPQQSMLWFGVRLSQTLIESIFGCGDRGRSSNCRATSWQRTLFNYLRLVSLETECVSCSMRCWTTAKLRIRS